MRYRTLSVVAACLMAAGCGGGGGGGGGGDGGAPSTPLTYTGSTSNAPVTTGNAAQLASNLTGGSSAAGSAGAVSGASLEGHGTLDIGKILRRGLRSASLPRSGVTTPTAAIAVDSTSACSSGGSVRVVGTLNDFAMGELFVSYNACASNGDTLHGTASMQVDLYDFVWDAPVDATLTFTRLTVRGATNADLTGTLRVQSNFPTNVETVTENLIVLYVGSGRMSKSENLVWTDVYDSLAFPNSYVESVAGTVFDSVHGYVTVSTVSPFVFSTTTQRFPDSGEVLFTGSTGSRASLAALSATLARIAVDADGNGVFEASARIPWSALSGALGTDLGDSDGDGMHNSWETAFGLNPSSAADAGADPDGDGQNNLAEYLAGTNPNTVNPAPPIPPTVLSLPGAAALVYDAVTQRIYAAVGGNPGTIVPINPVTGVLGGPIAVGNTPSRLAISDDGQYFYVGLSGQGAVQRVQVAPPNGILDISLGVHGFFGPHYADDIAVLPGAPQSVAVSLRYQGTSPRHAGVAIYDNAVARPNLTAVHTGANAIEFSASAATLYGYNNETTAFGFYRMAVDASGVAVVDVRDTFYSAPPEVGALFTGFGIDMKFGGGLIFATTGAVVDPVARTLLGTVSLPVPFGNFVVPDAGLNRVFYLTLNGAIWEIRAFDMATRALLGTTAIPGVTGTPGSLIRWGARGLAFRTSTGQIVLIESTTLIP